jgi:hypothetical protein
MAINILQRLKAPIHLYMAVAGSVTTASIVGLANLRLVVATVTRIQAVLQMSSSKGYTFQASI